MQGAKHLDNQDLDNAAYNDTRQSNICTAERTADEHDTSYICLTFDISGLSVLADHRSVSTARLSSILVKHPHLTLRYLLAKAVFVVIIIVVVAVVAFLLLHHDFVHEAGRAPLIFLLLRRRGAPHLHDGQRETAPLSVLRILLAVGRAVTHQLPLCHHPAGQCVAENTTRQPILVGVYTCVCVFRRIGAAWS